MQRLCLRGTFVVTGISEKVSNSLCLADFCVAYLHCKYSHTLLASRMFQGMRSPDISDIPEYCLLYNNFYITKHV